MPGTFGVAGAGLWLWVVRTVGCRGTLLCWFGLRRGGDGENHAGHGVDRLGVGQALVQAQGAPGPERDRVADDRAQPAVLVVGAAERCGEDVAEEAVLVPQGLLVLLGQGGEVAVGAGQQECRPKSSGGSGMNRIESWAVADAVRALRPDHRVLLETYYHGKSVSEAATTLGIPAGTVKSRTFYALRALKQALEEKGLAP